ncbi:MAG: glycosyltransferase family 4 protein [Candidatus Hodarchaeales archaeon]|jgi:glycosyltransferase involved in cell wall biosynthesis
MILAVSSIPRDPRMDFKERLPDQVAKRLRIPIYYFRPVSLGFYYLDFALGILYNLLRFRKRAAKAEVILCFIPQLLPFVLLSRKPTIFVAVDDYEGTIYQRKIKKLAFMAIKRLFVPKTQMVVCTTEYIRRRYRKVISESRLKLIRVGVDTSIFHPTPQPSTDPFVLYYHGKLRKDYNTDFLVQVMRYLPENFELWLVGDGPQRPLLEKMVHQGRLQHRVKFWGKKPYEELPGIIKRANVCLNPIPVLGTKLYQYFAAGKPVVSLCGQINEIALNEVHYICTARNPKAQAEAIMKLKSNPNLAEQLGKNAREQIMNQSWSVILNLYEEAVVHIQ